MNCHSQVRQRAMMLVLSGLTTAGCVGRSMTILSDRPLSMTAPASVTISPPVSILAVGGTQQLTPLGLTFGGTPVTAFDSVLYQYVSVGDSASLRLSKTGLMTGVKAGPGVILINVFAYQGAGVVGDQVLAQVTAAAIPGLALSIQPVAPDSMKLAMASAKTIVPVLRNPTTGVGVTNPAMEYRVKGADSVRVNVYRPGLFITGSGGGQDFFRVRAENPTLGLENGNVSLSPNQIVPLTGEGTAWVYAVVNAYGTLLQDSVQYTFTYPYVMTVFGVKANLEVASIFAGQAVTLAPGATVTFRNGVAAADPLTMTYTFDNPAAAIAASPTSTVGGASGNVTPLTGGQTSSRKFVSSGTYRWTLVAAGGPAPWPGQTVSGTIVIK